MAETSTPAPMARCILRALTNEGYKDVMRRPPGTYSLQAELAQRHTALRLNQFFAGTTAYPAMRVVDLLPATYCAIDADAAATVIVLPPASTPIPTLGACEATDAAAAAPLDDSDEVLVCLNASLRGSTALASPRALTALLLEGAALVRVPGCGCDCVFTVTPSDAADASAAVLEVSPALFRNVRAAALGHPAQALTAAAMGVSFADTALRLPLDAFQAVDNGDDGELLSRAAAATTHVLSKMVLSPAVEDAALTELYGLYYPDLCALFAAASAAAWEGCVVSTGDVLYLEDDVLNAVAERLDGVDALESVARVLAHKVRQWKGTWVDEKVSSRHLLALRVVRLERAGVAVPFGVLRGCGGAASEVEVALVHQRNSQDWDSTPVWAPAPPGGLAGIDVFDRLCAALRPVAAPSLARDVHAFVVHGIKENLPREFVECAVARFGLPCVAAAADGLEEAELEELLRTFLGEPCGAATVLVVHNAHTIATACPHILSVLDELSNGCGAVAAGAQRRGQRLVFLLCESMEAVPPMIAARATNADGVVECGNPSEGDRAAFIAPLLQWACERHRVHASLLLSAKTFAGWTVGLSYADILALVEECARDAALQHPACGGASDGLGVVSDVSCEPVVQAYLKSHGYNMVSTKLQPVRWSDVGGLEEAKRELRETIQLPILHPELFENGMKKRTGVLFYGPPGCGKTLLAKAVATEMNMNFMSVKGPELINQYVGESEKNIRLLFQRARDNSPCIVFFDELDALAPARGAKGDAGGVMDRIVSQLLVEVDGVGQKRSDGTASGDVFIIGATNRPDLLDAALLRPGRFDRLCYLGIPATRDEQLFALKALTRKFDMAADVQLAAVLEPLDFVYTGADFFALCSDAMMFAVEDALEAAQQDIASAVAAEAAGVPAPAAAPDAAAEEGEEAKSIKVCMDHFLRARAQLKPSVTKADLKKYEALKLKFNKASD